MCFCHLLGLMVQHDEVTVLEVEAVQLVAGGFGVHDIFKDDEGGAFCIACDTLADLSGEASESVRVMQYGTVVQASMIAMAAGVA